MLGILLLSEILALSEILVLCGILLRETRPVGMDLVVVGGNLAQGGIQPGEPIVFSATTVLLTG